MNPLDDGTIKSLKTNQQDSSERPYQLHKKEDFPYRLIGRHLLLTEKRLKFQIIKRSPILKGILEEERIVGKILRMFRKTAKFSKKMTIFSFNDDNSWKCWNQIIAIKEFWDLPKTFRSLICLRQINFYFNYSGITDKGLIRISQCLKEMPLLQKISLVFLERIQITKKGFHSLSKSLKRLRFLRDLTLVLDDSEDGITDDSLNEIGKGLERCSSLQNIHLSLSYSQITDKGLEILTKSLRKLQLKSLLIDFQDVIGFTDLGIFIASEYLKKIVSLQKVDLDFSECCDISYNSVYMISDALKCLPVIKKITLQFDGCAEIEFIDSDGTEDIESDRTEYIENDEIEDIESTGNSKSNNSSNFGSKAGFGKTTNDSNCERANVMDSADHELIGSCEDISNYVIEDTKEDGIENNENSKSNNPSNFELRADFGQVTDDPNWERANMMEIISRYSKLPRGFSKATEHAETELKKISTVKSVKVRSDRIYW